MRLCSRCNQCGETADPCNCTDDLITADQEIAELKEQLAEAEQRAAQAECEAVRECERIASRHIANAQHVAYQIRNRYPQHFEEE